MDEIMMFMLMAATFDFRCILWLDLPWFGEGSRFLITAATALLGDYL